MRVKEPEPEDGDILSENQSRKKLLTHVERLLEETHHQEVSEDETILGGPSLEEPPLSPSLSSAS